jgi:carbon-monoxide dehydrogenase medium subunit
MTMPSPGLPEFNYVKPASLAEASRMLTEHAGKARPMMGGTDLFVRMRDGFVRAGFLVDVKHLPGMRHIRYKEQVGLTVGAATTLNAVAHHPVVQARYPLLAEAANSVASYQLRNRATLGGNLCNASPAADTAPATLLLEASMVLYGPSGERMVPADEFFLGPGKTAIRPGELMTAIRFPVPPAGHAGKYLKLGRNKAGDLAIAGVAALGFLDTKGTKDDGTTSGCQFRIGLASVAPVPLRARQAEKALSGSSPGEETFALAAEKAAQRAMEAATPISDVRASAAYRKAMVRALTLRALLEIGAELTADTTEMIG